MIEERHGNAILIDLLERELDVAQPAVRSQSILAVDVGLELLAGEVRDVGPHDRVVRGEVDRCGDGSMHLAYPGLHIMRGSGKIRRIDACIHESAVD